MLKRLLLIIIVLILATNPAWSFWMWTPETNKWVNPKYSVKETPQDQLDHAVSFYEAKEYPEAIQECQKLIKHYPKAKEAADAQYYIARSREDLGKLDQAFNDYQMVIDKYPFSARAPEIVKRQYDIATHIVDGSADQNKFFEAFKDKYAVIEMFRTVIKNAPYGTLAAPSQYKIGLYLLENSMYQEARDEFEKLLNDYPESEWTKGARYQIAVADASRSTDAQYDQKVTASAVSEFEEFVKNYPDAQMSAKAKEQIVELREKEAENNFMVAQYYEKIKNYKAAKIYYQNVVSNYNSTSWSKKALEKIRAINAKLK